MALHSYTSGVEAQIYSENAAKYRFGLVAKFIANQDAERVDASQGSVTLNG